MKRSFLSFLMFLPSICLAQPDSAAFAVFLKGGLSEYTYIVPGGLGGSRSSTSWKMGPTMGLGFELPASRTVSIMFVLDYSTNPCQTPNNSQLLNGAKARTVDLSVNARGVANPIYLAGGVGFSHTNRDEVRFRTRIDSSRVVLNSLPEEGETTLFLNLVFGLQYTLTGQLSVFIQGNARIRSYSTFAVEMGVAYGL